MNLTQPLVRLPVRFCADTLAAEMAALPPQAWVPHPTDYEGNDAALLVTPGGRLEQGFIGPMAAIGQEVNLMKAQRALAERGYHWLVVYAPDDRQATRVAQVARDHYAERAQRYGNFIIEELIVRPADRSPVAESPDRGLDAQTPSGQESERAQMRPPGRHKPQATRRPR